MPDIMEIQVGDLKFSYSGNQEFDPNDAYKSWMN